MTPPSPPPPAADAWLIYPAAKAFIRSCAIVFGACSMLVGFLHIFMAVLVHSTQRAEGFMRTGTWAALLGILSLSCIAMWGSRVLLASRGSRITRVLSAVTVLPALYALLIPFTAQPVPFQYAEMGRTWETFLLLAAVTAFFAFPYTRGYPAPGRNCSWPGASWLPATPCKASCFSCSCFCGTRCPTCPSHWRQPSPMQRFCFPAGWTPRWPCFPPSWRGPCAGT